VGCEWFAHVGEHRTGLEAAGDRDRGDAFDESIAIVGLGAVGEFAVDDEEPDRLREPRRSWPAEVVVIERTPPLVGRTLAVEGRRTVGVELGLLVRLPDGSPGTVALSATTLCSSQTSARPASSALGGRAPAGEGASARRRLNTPIPHQRDHRRATRPPRPPDPHRPVIPHPLNGDRPRNGEPAPARQSPPHQTPGRRLGASKAIDRRLRTSVPLLRPTDPALRAPANASSR